MKGPTTEEVATFKASLDALWDRIRAVTDRPVRVVAVSKTHPVEACMTAMAAGVSDLGENYAQELAAKAGQLAGDGANADQIRWHFIGGLQRNKVRLIAPFVSLWHTVDRESLAAEIGRRAPGARVLIQVDLAGTDGRSGCTFEDLDAAVKAARSSGLTVEGLMGIAPIGDEASARQAFRRLAGAARDRGLSEVSMGMSGDLEIALEEGATIVRIGTDLFGPRQRKN